MAVEHLLDFDRRNILPARDDDVLRAILEVDVAVRMPHAEVARMEPPAGEGLLRRLRILQIALHHDIAAHENLSHRAAVARHGRSRAWIGDHEALQYGVA